MNFRRGIETSEDTFQIAPLVDIAFLLLIFFILTGALAAQEKEHSIELARTTSAVVQPRKPGDIVVNVMRDGKIKVQNQPYELEMLQKDLEMIQGPENRERSNVNVIIRPDAKVAYQHIARVIDVCVAAKVSNISFVSLEKKTP